MTCLRNDNVTVANSFCSADPSPTSSVLSKAGSVVVSPTNSSLVNGSEYMTCNAGATTGTRVVMCVSNYHIEGATLATQNCFSNTRSCSVMPTGAVSAIETWNSVTSSYSSCTVNSCNISQNYIKVGNSCVLCGAGEVAQSNNTCLSGTASSKLYFNFNSAIWNISTTSTKGWGFNTGYQLGLGTNSNTSTPSTINFGTSRYPKVVIPNYNGTSMYAILDNDTLVSWGANSNGQLGTGDTVTKTTPTVVNVGGKLVKSVITGSKSACAITTDGLLYCWGRNDFGELALGSGTVGTTITSPTQVSLGSGRTVYEANFGNSNGNNKDVLCVILDNFSLQCAGYNSNGQLGTGDTSQKNVLTSINLGSGVTAKKLNFLVVPSDGSMGTCIIDNSNNLRCWGDNTFGKLGTGDTSFKTTPTLINVGSGLTVKKVIASSNRYTTCAILNDDSLKCWGENTNGQVGDNSYTHRYSPVPIPVGVGRSVKNLFNYNNSYYAILDNNTLVSWGLNYQGQLGIGSTSDAISPQTVSLSGQTVSQVKTTDYLTCLLTVSGNVMCAGTNVYGSVGINSGSGFITTFSTVSLGSGRTATELYVYQNSACALLDNNTVKCWGSGLYGKMGSGSTSDQAYPMPTL